MRTTTKFLAAAALAALSASSFAIPADWTGNLSAVKIKYIPNNSVAGGGIVMLTGTGSPCTFVTTPGFMLLSSSSSAGGDEARNLFNFLVTSKNAGHTVTLTYEPSVNTCDIKGYTR
jgi:hypothetical protein